jgi:endo-1,4-beta-xylanase
MTLNSGQTIAALWNGSAGTSGNVVTVKPVGWNSTIAAGKSASFGFTASAPSGNVSNPSISCSTP